MAQVKFYAKAEMPSENIDQNGIYFITTGGEIYKGATRFGCGRVTKASTAEELEALTGMARGDINVGYEGAKVFDGTSWASLAAGVDPSQWQADISTWTAGLVAGGEGSYITGITQAPDGKLTASAEAFPTLASGGQDGQIKLGNQVAAVSGWSKVTGLETAVNGISASVSEILGIVDVSANVVAATTGSFTNLTVTDTATFSVTNVSAEALTINGSTVEEIADAQIAAISSATATSTANGITVSVTTAGGSVTTVSVNATSFGNVMHFAGVVSTPAAVATPSRGDIVVIGSQPGAGCVTGQEYIYTNAGSWELIGDQNSYALNAYSSSATVLAGATTLPTAIDALGAAVDALNSNVTNLGISVSELTSSVASIAESMTSLATKADATLTPIYDGGAEYGDWELDPQISYEDAYPVRLRLTEYGWEPYAHVDDGETPPYDTSVGAIGAAKGGSDSVELSWTAQEDGLFTFTATRALNRVTGYTLGSQDDKPLAPKAEVEALRAEVEELRAALNWITT